MFIQKYMLKDPRDGKFTEVFHYPGDLASPTIRDSRCILVSRELLRPPIMVVPKEYLTAMDGRGEILDSTYADLSLLTHFTDEIASGIKKDKFDSNIEQVKSIFALGTAHKRFCKTMFFTGPKNVYKKTLMDDWQWTDKEVLTLMNWGHFRTIDSLSLKGVNDVFITGTFVAEGDIVKNTQCKITVSNN